MLTQFAVQNTPVNVCSAHTTSNAEGTQGTLETLHGQAATTDCLHCTQLSPAASHVHTVQTHRKN